MYPAFKTVVPNQAQFHLFANDTIQWVAGSLNPYVTSSYLLQSRCSPEQKLAQSSLCAIVPVVVATSPWLSYGGKLNVPRLASFIKMCWYSIMACGRNEVSSDLALLISGVVKRIVKFNVINVYIFCEDYLMITVDNYDDTITGVFTFFVNIFFLY